MPNLAPARRYSDNRRRSTVLFDALEPRALFAATPTTTTLTLSTPVLAANHPLTLTAAVSADPGSPAPTGTVAFFEVVDLSKDPYHAYDYTQFVTFPDSSTAHILGAATLAADGTATLSLDSFPSSSAVYTGRFRAAFLGADPAFSIGLPNAFGITTSVAYADPGQILSPDVTYPNSSTTSAESTRRYVLFPQGHPLAIHNSQITVLTDLPSGVTSTDPSAAVYLTDQDGAQTFYLAPTTTPLWVQTSATVTWNSTIAAYTPGHYTYSTSFIPVPAFAHAFDASAAFESSLSELGIPAPDQPTALNISTSGPFTYTNPPAITVSLANPNGGSYSRHAPNPAARGDYQQAHAGVDVQISTGASGTYTSGLSMSGGTINIGHPVPPFVPAGPYPTGTVSFFDENNTLLATLPLDADGNATFYPDPRSLSVGTHSIHAVYSGDAVYHAADASTAPFTLARAATTLSISGLFDTVYSGTTLSLRAGVQTTTRETVTPTGTFTFLVDGQAFATLPALPGPPTSYGGTPSQLPLTLPPGTHTLTVAYSGDADFLASSSTANFTVLASPVTPPTSPTPPHYYPGTYQDPFWGVISDAAPASLSPDYFPVSVEGGPSTGYVAGGSVSFRASVLYTGTGHPNVPGTPLTFALSLDDVAGNADDIPLAAQENLLYVATLNFDSSGHATHSNSYTAYLPAGLAPGTYHIVATADAGNSTAETDETNNALVSSWTITVTDPSDGLTPAVPSQPTPVLVTPDLAGTLTPARPTATVNAPASLKLTLTNPSKTKTVARKYAVTYYLSTDATFSSDDTKFSKQVINVNLGKKQTKSYTLNYKLPTTAPLGTRYLIAVADLADSLPSITSGVKVASSKPLKILGPHLAATVRSVTPTNRPDTVKVTVRVLNDGSAAFTGPATLRLLSDTPTADTLLLTARKSATLKAGKYADYTFTVRRPTAGATLSVTVA